MKLFLSAHFIRDMQSVNISSKNNKLYFFLADFLYNRYGYLFNIFSYCKHFFFDRYILNIKN